MQPSVWCQSPELCAPKHPLRPSSNDCIRTSHLLKRKKVSSERDLGGNDVPRRKYLAEQINSIVIYFVVLVQQFLQFLTSFNQAINCLLASHQVPGWSSGSCEVPVSQWGCRCQPVVTTVTDLLPLTLSDDDTVAVSPASLTRTALPVCCVSLHWSPRVLWLCERDVGNM